VHNGRPDLGFEPGTFVLFTYFDLTRRQNWEKKLELAIGGESPTVRSPVLPPSRVEVVLQHLFTQGVNAKYVGIDPPGRGWWKCSLSARARYPSPLPLPVAEKAALVSGSATPPRSRRELRCSRRNGGSLWRRKKERTRLLFANELHIILLSSITFPHFYCCLWDSSFVFCGFVSLFSSSSWAWVLWVLVISQFPSLVHRLLLFSSLI
jgi:hypothetical protein